MTAYFVAAILVLIIGFIIAMKRYADLKAFSLTLTGAITLAIMILAFPHFKNEYQDVVLALLATLRYGPSAISLKVDSDIPSSLLLNEPLASMYKVLLYSLYLLGPMCASVAIISYTRLLGEWLLTLRYGTIHVFSRLEERSISIAESIAAEEKKHLIIFCNAAQVRDETLKSRARAIRAMLLNKRETQIHLRKNRSYEFYELAETSEKCLINATSLCEDLLKEKNFEAKNVVVRIFISRRSLEYIRRLDRSFGRKLYLRYVDADNAIAIEALRKLKPWLINRSQLNIAVVNVSSSAQQLISHLIYLLTEPDTSMKMHILDCRADELVSQLKINSPEVLNLPADSYLQSRDTRGRNYDIDFALIRDKDNSIIEALDRLEVPDLLILADPDDEVNLRLMEQLKRYYASQNSDLIWPKMAVQIGSRQLNRILEKDEKVIYFGNQAKMYSYENIVHPELERAAKRVHLVYCGCDLAKMSGSQQEETLEETGYYDYVNIDSSLANALTLEYRYDYIAAQLPSKEEDTGKAIERWLAEPENLKKIGDGEHERWSAYQRLQGWRLATVAQQEKLASDWSNPRVKDNELLLHAALVSVEELPQAEKQADVLLGRPTRYVQLDRDFYTHIREILEK